jgi:hypothetical protein
VSHRKELQKGDPLEKETIENLVALLQNARVRVKASFFRHNVSESVKQGNEKFCN